MSVGNYLYCIIRCSQERTFEGVAPIGALETPVHTIPHDGLAAVVSDSPLERYEITRANMLAHERVEERVMQEFVPLPVRFGTVADAASPAQKIQRLLEKRAQEFHALLLEMEGKVELGLKAFWRAEEAVFAEILTENSDIRRLRDSLSGKPPEVGRLQAIRLGEMVKKALEDKRRREAAALLAPLRPIACRTKEIDVVLDRMLCNAAFLVDQDRGDEFDQAVRRLDEQWGPRASFRYTGPNPPWNFVEIVVNWTEL